MDAVINFKYKNFACGMYNLDVGHMNVPRPSDSYVYFMNTSQYANVGMD